jgi:hypothetical protein
MLIPKLVQVTLAALLFGLIACGAPTPPTPEPTASAPEPPPEPSIEITPTVSLPLTGASAPQLSFTPATYVDESAGFALDYPVEWTVDPSSQIGMRGGQALLLSPGSTAETVAAGGSRISLVTYVWDPKNDLDAYVTQRKVAWDASGFAIEREEQWQLNDGRAVYGFVLLTPSEPTFTVLTTVGEDYLQISGEGDPTLTEEIIRTLRPTS